MSDAVAYGEGASPAAPTTLSSPAVANIVDTADSENPNNLTTLWTTGRLQFCGKNIDRGNAAVPDLEIKEADRKSKGKAGQLSELFDTDAQLDEFLEI